MRWRTGFAWAVAGSAGLAALLVLACHPGFAAAAPAGMSAPKAPAASIEAGPAAQLLQSPFDHSGHVMRGLSCSPSPAGGGAGVEARQTAQADPAAYGPLHRRPPPSFS